jgi:hypothetical protein
MHLYNTQILRRLFKIPCISRSSGMMKRYERYEPPAMDYLLWTMSITRLGSHLGSLAVLHCSIPLLSRDPLPSMGTIESRDASCVNAVDGSHYANPYQSHKMR